MERSNLLLLSWPIDARLLADIIPAPLETDLFDGQAWVTLTSATVSGARHSLAPPIPGLSSFMELSLRTYVRCGGEAGVFLLSIDTSSLPAVWLARGALHLPCFRASMEFEREGDTVLFSSRRRHQGAVEGRHRCRWEARGPVPRPNPGSLVHFVTERMLSFSVHHGRTRVSKMSHPSLSLRDAHVISLETTMLEAAGLPRPDEPPFPLHCDHLSVALVRSKCPSGSEEAAGLLDPALAPPPLGFGP